MTGKFNLTGLLGVTVELASAGERGVAGTDLRCEPGADLQRGRGVRVAIAVKSGAANPVQRGDLVVESGIDPVVAGRQMNTAALRCIGQRQREPAVVGGVFLERLRLGAGHRRDRQAIGRGHDAAEDGQHEYQAT